MSSADDSGESSPLLALLRARIEREGPMPVDAYMRACLADPEHGYWQRLGDDRHAAGISSRRRRSARCSAS